MTFDNNSATTNIESWFIPIDILLIISTGLAIILATIFLIIIIFDKKCRTVPMMLVANSYLAELIFSSDMFATALFALQNDLKQIQYQDSLCIFRSYLSYASYFLQSYSYLLPAIYRYINVVYPNRPFWQSARFQGFLICLTWILGFAYPTPYSLTGEIKYIVDSQICQMPLRLSFFNIYNPVCTYVIPISLLMLIYFKLVRYIREMSKRVTSVNTLSRAQRELKMVRGIVILVMGVVTIGLPYAIFVFMSYFTTPPKYHFRIAFIFVDVSVTFIIIALFLFTDPLKAAVMKRIKARSNGVIPMVK